MLNCGITDFENSAFTGKSDTILLYLDHDSGIKKKIHNSIELANTLDVCHSLFDHILFLFWCGKAVKVNSHSVAPQDLTWS